MKLPVPPLLLITDRRQAAQPLEAVVRAALQGGCRWVSLREKDLDPAARRALLERLVAIGRAFAARVTVHDDLDAASLGGGLHLPRDGDAATARRHLSPDALLGQSAHDLASAQRAAANADYITLSPVFASRSKPGYGPALGAEGLRRVAARLSCPVIALGGVTADKVAACRAAGAAGVAVMGAIMAASDPAREAARMVTLFTQKN